MGHVDSVRILANRSVGERSMVFKLFQKKIPFKLNYMKYFYKTVECAMNDMMTLLLISRRV